MAAATIYHNPRCTKSRQAMQVATELGADVEVVKYLDTPPDAATLRSIIAKLEDPVADLVRRERLVGARRHGRRRGRPRRRGRRAGRPSRADAAPDRRAWRPGRDRPADGAGHRDPALSVSTRRPRPVHPGPVADPSQAGPLDDLVVLDLTIARAGPTAVRYLADWGARVLRIERRDHGGSQFLADHETSDYLNLHRSKALIQLDLARRRRPPRAVPPRRARRRPRREQPGAGEGQARHRLRDVGGDQPAPRLRQHLRLRPGRPGQRQGCRRPDHPGRRRADEHHRPARRWARTARASPSPTRPPGTSWRSASCIALHERAADRPRPVGEGVAARGDDLVPRLPGRALHDRRARCRAARATTTRRCDRWAPTGPPTATSTSPRPGERFWRRLCDVLGDPALARRRALRDARAAATQHRAELDAVLDARFATRPRDEWIALLDAAGHPVRAGQHDRRGVRRPAGAAPGDAGDRRPPDTWSRSTCCATRSRCRAARPWCRRRRRCPAPIRARCSTRSASPVRLTGA